jgi:hypothetical protein
VFPGDAENAIPLGIVPHPIAGSDNDARKVLAEHERNRAFVDVAILPIDRIDAGDADANEHVVRARRRVGEVLERS